LERMQAEQTVLVEMRMRKERGGEVEFFVAVV
jgi:hypothetical protein